MASSIHLRKMGFQCILIQFEAAQTKALFATVKHLQKEYAKDILDLVPSYQEIAVYLHQHSPVDEMLKALNSELPLDDAHQAKTNSPIYRIPVCYDAEMGIDLVQMAESKGMSCAEIIERHTAPIYTIHFLGFLPGFPYLSGLDPKLHHPRHPQARQKVSAGAVGIAGNQTGIYPQASPGGWNIIGQSPLQFFDVHQHPPALLHQANRLQFFQIDRDAYKEIKEAVKHKSYQLEISYD